MATHRLALMISHETGPDFIFKKIRAIPPKQSSWKKGLSCFWCVSVWMAALITFLLSYSIGMKWNEWLVFGYAISSGAICINQYFTKS